MRGTEKPTGLCGDKRAVLGQALEPAGKVAARLKSDIPSGTADVIEAVDQGPRGLIDETTGPTARTDSLRACAFDHY
jgi:hypothetical protein